MAEIMTAKEGYVFFNGETGGKTLILGKNENIENWQQITEQKFNEFLLKSENEEQVLNG